MRNGRRFIMTPSYHGGRPGDMGGGERRIAMRNGRRKRSIGREWRIDRRPGVRTRIRLRISGWQGPRAHGVIYRGRMNGIKISRERNVVVVMVRRPARVEASVQLLLRSLLVQPIYKIFVFFDLGFRFRQLSRSLLRIFFEFDRFLAFDFQFGFQLVLFGGEGSQGVDLLLQRLLLFLRNLIAQF